jgi:hypothetical protein
VTCAEGHSQGQKVDLSRADWAKLRKLRQASAGEPLAEYTAEIQGQTSLFMPVRYVLSDSTEVLWAEGQPLVAK